MERCNRHVEPNSAHTFQGTGHDVGDKLGMLEANIEYGLKHSDTKDGLKAYLKELLVKID